MSGPFLDLVGYVGFTFAHSPPPAVYWCYQPDLFLSRIMYQKSLDRGSSRPGHSCLYEALHIPKCRVHGGCVSTWVCSVFIVSLPTNLEWVWTVASSVSTTGAV